MNKKYRHGPNSTVTDIAFLLLLFFLILSISTQQTPLPLQAASAHAEILEDTDISTIVVSHTGELFLDGSSIALDSIPRQDTYALLADRNTPYEIIHPIITFLKERGVGTLYCLVEDHP
ncbi:biopolymer transporter ExbD [uncultured Sphaerochaeta sp.]|uniref:biopolymer transporter ExbD n=1 Tax=uncultured Sphaerochaeta sp. TaxID=886478 RepID=UPI0029CA53F2|nr:biopolymer transporter ExbD [uncultured Sphaerochaeta sp.]